MNLEKRLALMIPIVFWTSSLMGAEIADPIYGESVQGLYTLTASATVGGSITPSGSFGVSAGSSQTFTATPNANSFVTEWLLDGNVVQAGGNSYTLGNIQANHVVQVTFTYALELFTVTASAGAGGSITPSGSFGAGAGYSQTFTATPNANFVVNHWMLDGNVVQTGGNSYTLGNIQANRTMQVTFTSGQGPFTVTAWAGAGGSISPSGSFGTSAGYSQTFAAMPDANYVVTQWLLDGIVAQTGGNSYTLGNIQANHSVQVLFTQGPFTVTAWAGPGGSISPSGSFGTSGGSSQTFTATPNANYVVNQWLVDGNAVQDGGNTYTLGNIQANYTVQVLFTPVPGQYTLTASAGAGGFITPSGSFGASAGYSQTFTATPNANYVVNQWLVDGNAVQDGGNTYTLGNIQANYTVRVLFTPVPGQYTLTASAGAGGFITPSGSFGASAGYSQTFTATPNANYVVNQWLVDGNAVQDGGNTYTLGNIQANYTVQVLFTYVPGPYTLTASAGAGGSITPSGGFGISAGSSQTFTATPNANYVVNQWMLDGNVAQNGGNSYTLGSVQANHVVAVTFTYVPGPYTLTASAGAGGAITPNGSFGSNAGSSQTFTATPNVGFVVNQWLVDGSVVQNGGNSYTLGSIQANHTVEVTFTYVLSCSFGLNPASASHRSGTETGTFDVWVQGGCDWTAITDDPWIHTSSGGNGLGTVSYTVDTNPGTSSRSGSILVQGHAFVINQAGTPVPTSNISVIPDQKLAVSTASSLIPFTLTGAIADLSNFSIVASSSNPDLIPVDNILFAGTGADRFVVVDPITGRSGIAKITVSIPDPAGDTPSTSFLVSVGNLIPISFSLGTLTLDAHGQFQCLVTAPAGQSMVVQVSTDLVTWRDLTSLEVPSGLATFTDPPAPGTVGRFYRIKSP